MRWLKRYAFKKKIKNYYNGDVNLFLDFVLNTNKEDWFYDEDFEEIRCKKRPFENTCCVFYYFNRASCFVVREGKNKAYIETIRIFDDNFLRATNIFYAVEEIKMKQIIFHLEQFFDEIYQEFKQKQKAKKEKKEEKKMEKMNKVKLQLQTFLTNIALPFEQKTEPPFHMELKQTKKIKTLIISYKERKYVEAFYHVETGKMKTDFLNSTKKVAQVFKEEENLILKCIYNLLVEERKTEAETKKELNEVSEAVNAIIERVEQLKREEQWLNQEAFHQLNYTIPTDLHKLSTVYFQLGKNSAVDEEVFQSLHYITQKLDAITYQIDKNKQYSIKQAIEVIKRR